MRNYDFNNSAGTNQQLLVAVLTAATPVAEVAVFNTAVTNKINIAFAVAVADLTDVKVFGRGDKNASWFEIPQSELYGYARTDGSTDYKTTPAGQSGMVAVDTPFWAEISLRMASAGAARVGISAGVE